MKNHNADCILCREDIPHSHVTDECFYPKVKPLSDDEISKIYNNLYESYKSDNVGIADFIMICRAIEKAHGIGEATCDS